MSIELAPTKNEALALSRLILIWAMIASTLKVAMIVELSWSMFGPVREMQRQLGQSPEPLATWLLSLASSLWGVVAIANILVACGALAWLVYVRRHWNTSQTMRRNRWICATVLVFYVVQDVVLLLN